MMERAVMSKICHSFLQLAYPHPIESRKEANWTRTSVKRNTNNARLTRVIDIHQITIQIQMLVPSHLHSGISWFLSLGTWWEAHLRVESVGWEVDFGEGLGGEVLGVGREDHFLDGGVGRLGPGGREGCHSYGLLLVVVLLYEQLI